MRILDLIQQAPALYESGTSLHLVGPPGCGKSDVLRNEVRDALSARYGEEFGYWDVLLPTIDAPDVRGFLVPTKGADGHANSMFTRSAILPPKEYLAEHPRGIMMLDERNAADLLTQKAVAPCVLWKRFGDEELPPGWWVCSASNRVSDRAGVIKPPTHLVNRERTINVDPDALSWAIWAERKGLHPMGIAFAKKFPGVVFTPTVPKDDGAFCTPRSFTAALNLLTNLAGRNSKGEFNLQLPNDPITQECVSGDVGEGASAQMFSFFKLHDQLPELEDILDDPSKAKCPNSLDAAYAAAQLCIHYAKPDTVDKLWAYCERLPKELQVSTAKSMIQASGGKLLNSKGLSKWISLNKALVVSTMS
jgi:hypothetical protein